nr:MAG TPA: hypothetical protein [Caudoviricetes sp.]
MNFYSHNKLIYNKFLPHCFCTIPHFSYFTAYFARKYRRTRFCTGFVQN